VCLFALQDNAFAQASDIEVKLETLFNSIESGTKVHIDHKRKVIIVLQQQASYEIPYQQITCSYLVDSGKRGLNTRTHCVRLKCLKELEVRGCNLKVKHADGWRGVTAKTIAFGSRADVDEFLELIALVRKL
jgi:hypothetical protein